VLYFLFISIRFESDFKALNLPLSLRFKGFGGHYNSN
jgi:hypothetical protein